MLFAIIMLLPRAERGCMPTEYFFNFCRNKFVLKKVFLILHSDTPGCGVGKAGQS